MQGPLPWAEPPKPSRMEMCWQQPPKRKALLGEKPWCGNEQERFR